MRKKQYLVYSIAADFEKENLLKQIEELQQENMELKSKTKHNARGAGRKPSQERINAITQVKALMDKGISDKDIQQKLGISKATFYRYKRDINSQ